jgi:hypothetical protein
LPMLTEMDKHSSLFVWRVPRPSACNNKKQTDRRQSECRYTERRGAVWNRRDDEKVLWYFHLLLHVLYHLILVHGPDVFVGSAVPEQLERGPGFDIVLKVRIKVYIWALFEYKGTKYSCLNCTQGSGGTGGLYKAISHPA